MSQTILLAGASGLIGRSVLERLLEQKFTVIAPTRSTLGVHSSLLQEISLDAPAKAFGNALGAAICCLGTTLKRAGSQAAFLKVDRDLTLRLASAARSGGARQLILVSSVGAAAQSRNFYLRAKGEIEQSAGKLGFDRVDFLQPSLLLGSRTELRVGERFGQRLAAFYNPLLLGPLKHYRAIAADTVARAAVSLLYASPPGIYRHRYAELNALANETHA